MNTGNNIYNFVTIIYIMNNYLLFSILLLLIVYLLYYQSCSLEGATTSSSTQLENVGGTTTSGSSSSSSGTGNIQLPSSSSSPANASPEYSVTLVKQLSDTKCVKNQNYGMLGSSNKMYVDQGCRGTFQMTPYNVPFNCSSENFKYTSCLTPGTQYQTSESVSNAINQLSETMTKNQQSANANAFTVEYSPQDDPSLFQTNTSLEPMPSSVIQKIKCKICPPPLGPEVANAQLTTINSVIQFQADFIEKLEKQVSDLEKRYKIKFQVQNSEYDPQNASSLPKMTVQGTVDNILLDVQMNVGSTGPIGPRGLEGSNGITGKRGPTGSEGPTGYWGNIL